VFGELRIFFFFFFFFFHKNNRTFCLIARDGCDKVTVNLFDGANVLSNAAHPGLDLPDVLEKVGHVLRILARCLAAFVVCVTIVVVVVFV
jgi:hypothetical protein